MIDRRTLLMAGAAFGALAAASQSGEAGTMTTEASTAQAVDWRKLTDDEWFKRLKPQQYQVLRKHGTEMAGSSPLNREKRKGVFHCAGCDLALFSSDTKFESGTGWPSFYEPLPGAVETKKDRSFFITRTEVHCARCLGHLGHVFEDGPPPTGLRYCMNGVAMSFVPSESGSS
ncbi:MAG TPA: peptide-methionine (R)-S-oxide reductase MsrB [Methyloceanibacter sp.]